MLKKLSLISLCAFTSALAYNNGYQPGDSWVLEESFLANKEGSGRFQQGDPKESYNQDAPIWFYLEALPGDEADAATPLKYSGYHSIGLGWGDQQVQPPDPETPKIEGYPYIVRGFGSAEKTIFIHPGPKDLLIAWQAPVAGRFKAAATFERGGDVGDGQRLSWTVSKKVVAEAEVAPKAGSTELATPEVKLKKGDRMYFRINANGSANDDSGVVFMEVSYEGP